MPMHPVSNHSYGENGTTWKIIIGNGLAVHVFQIDGIKETEFFSVLMDDGMTLDPLSNWLRQMVSK